MKKLIRYLADYFGVTRQIRKETGISIGKSLLRTSYWWNGGVMYKESINDIQNFSILYGEALIDGHNYPDISSIRDDVYLYKKENINLQTDREVYGYSDRKTCYFVHITELESELQNPSSPIYGKRVSDLVARKRVKQNNQS